MTVLDRFLKYVTFDTQSNEETGTTPSTPGQRVFAEVLVKELEAIGMEEISLDENSYVMATLPANTDEKIPTIELRATGGPWPQAYHVPADTIDQLDPVIMADAARAMCIAVINIANR